MSRSQIAKDPRWAPEVLRALFPGEWVVGTPAEAAERILRLTGSVGTWREAGRVASQEAIRRWDWGTVRHGYERLILGSSAVRGR